MNRCEQRGRDDAMRGMTSCPYAIPANAKAWARGHDQAMAEGLGPHPRFARICPRRQSIAERELFD